MAPDDRSADTATPLLRLVAAFDDMASLVRVTDDPTESMRSITVAATTVIPGCDAASLSIVTPTGPETAAATDELAMAGDRIQYAEGQGPCLDAAMNERWVHTPDLANDPRWGRSSTRIAHELGVGSMLACRLAHEATPARTTGAFNLYARATNAFSEDDIALAILLASLSVVVVESAIKRANLTRAIESREVIGEAIGMIRAQSAVSREAAFDILVRASRRMNVKLRTIAEEIVERPAVVRDAHAG